MYLPDTSFYLTVYSLRLSSLAVYIYMYVLQHTLMRACKKHFPGRYAQLSTAWPVTRLCTPAYGHTVGLCGLMCSAQYGPACWLINQIHEFN